MKRMNCGIPMELLNAADQKARQMCSYVRKKRINRAVLIEEALGYHLENAHGFLLALGFRKENVTDARPIGISDKAHEAIKNVAEDTGLKEVQVLRVVLQLFADLGVETGGHSSGIRHKRKSLNRAEDVGRYEEVVDAEAVARMARLRQYPNNPYEQQEKERREKRDRRKPETKEREKRERRKAARQADLQMSRSLQQARMKRALEEREKWERDEDR